MAWDFIFALQFQCNTSSEELLTALPWIGLEYLLQTKEKKLWISFNFLVLALHPPRLSPSPWYTLPHFQGAAASVHSGELATTVPVYLETGA